ncbi:MAG: hypothetical protein AAGF48_13540 [Pseudomonadota bacterium]
MTTDMILQYFANSGIDIANGSRASVDLRYEVLWLENEADIYPDAPKFGLVVTGRPLD